MLQVSIPAENFDEITGFPFCQSEMMLAPKNLETYFPVEPSVGCISLMVLPVKPSQYMSLISL